ncbi:MAG: ABC transporter ATP-binding protein [Actinomycetota bacterium]
MPGSPVLSVENLKTRFHTQDGTVHAVNGVTFQLNRGELLGVVGESGSGKSVTMMSLLKLIPMPPGEIADGGADFDGVNLIDMPADQMQDIRGGRIGFIFQDPMTSLNPVLTVGRQIGESLELHTELTKAERHERCVELLEMVGIPDPEQRLKAYPHELSGGMRQRVVIAIALACEPEVIIADEPTTALDVTIQAQIIEEIGELRKRLGTAVVWITHDLGVIAGLADRVVVMYGGRIVEQAPVKTLYASPQHPYTQGLLASLPQTGSAGEKLYAIPGTPPNLLNAPVGCSFAPRCEYAFDRCTTDTPTLEAIGSDSAHEVACWFDIDKGEPR